MSGRFVSLRYEQGIASLAPLCGYPPKAKGVTAKVTPFTYFTVLRTPPKSGLFLCLTILATRKRVCVFLDRHLIHHFILYELVADVFLYCFLVLSYRVYVVTTAPEVPAPILVFEICVTIEYH